MAEDELWHPAAFWSRKSKKAEANYSTTDKELFAIVSSFEEWRQYVDGVQDIVMLTDHANLQSRSQQTRLLGRQARFSCARRLTVWDQAPAWHVKPADGPSWRPDYADVFEAEELLPGLKRKVELMQATMA